MNNNDKKALNTITNQAAKVTQSELTSIDDLYCNVLWQTVVTHCPITMYMRTGNIATRLHALSCRTQRYRTSFVTNSIGPTCD